MFYEAFRARRDMTFVGSGRGKSKRSFSVEDESPFADPQIDLTGWKHEMLHCLHVRLYQHAGIQHVKDDSHPEELW